MKYSFPFLFSVAIVFFSCSSDDNGARPNESPIVGTWSMSDINLDNDANTGELQLAALAIESLLADNCEIVVFTFSEDGTLESRDKIENLEVTTGVNGFEVNCPNESNIFNSTWSLVDNQLTIVNEEDMEETIEINLDGNTMTIAGEDVGSDDFVGADVVFTKQ
ncbi:lipocalin-like domain-containing protein [Costertonia aggregata]|uniref:Lipocalin family protein n=1 Tax=Costertonia aggregata TaxID=343403 RepID=A0A7H9AME7_9FLAO|nr:lipocalin family protein [Costertonia aggregata]QLG44597.1 lipocalin family protein [Costertonia aggregata]